jgi:hypothetical protein
MAHLNRQRGTDLGTLITHTAASAGSTGPVFGTNLASACSYSST